MLKLNVITVSTRPTRIGPAIAKWFVDYAYGMKQQGKHSARLSETMRHSHEICRAIQSSI